MSLQHRLTYIVFWVGLLLAVGGGAFPGSAEPDAPAQPYWEFFCNKGPATPDAATLRAIAASYPPATWARRARAGQAAVPDEHDLPLWRPYVDEAARFGRLRHESRWLNAVSMDLSPAGLAEVRGLAFVTGVRAVAIARTSSLGPAFDKEGRPLERTIETRTGVPNRTEELDYGVLDYGPSQGQLEEITVPPLHLMGYSGNRVRFMVLDTGFRVDHDAFLHSNILGTWDFIFEDPVVQNEEEDHEAQHGHGTGCWGTAGGYAPGNLIGPGYGAMFVLAKTEDIRSETQAEEDNYVAALEWADSLGVSLTTASLSYVCFDDSFCYEYEDKDGDTAVITIAIDIAAQRGILCCNAMGNYYCYEGSIGTPADADSILACGAVDSLNVIADFSACGPTYDGRTKPEVVARGVETHWVSASETDTYGQASGTSLSTPLVAGAAALLFEAHPDWSNMEVRQALMETADRTEIPDNEYGRGRIDTEAAAQWEPITFPRPFSLLSPEDEAFLDTRNPTFEWPEVDDPDQVAALEYTVHIYDKLYPEIEYEVSAGSDTTLTLDFDLGPLADYCWEVYAEDIAGHRRVSREVWTLHTAELSGVDDDVVRDERGPQALIALQCGPNPCRDALRFEITLADQARQQVADEPLKWAVYDPAGRRIRHGQASSRDGVYQDTWHGDNASGGAAPVGVYYLEARVGPFLARETLIRLTP